ncbi:MAG: Gfo/Idh/MocA family oxidoreductase [Armatimonadota bacterium]|nr:Gfo/Idh/MocA family oxidoreductase [Armatimonadota bacterium]MDR7451607.1 Gfo/Idh/MocA family oxidoreductase [Armatimonadota bacterium]MDR7467673.1 Gfo/Idh/MocA family oxidoreductase [Armatimonadota bacterium]MDR7492576.1 Gfo/Idh/MocA family oxidoreductase [Armatimonadota bacterium]MDR7499956.1 Gfo/Idh/MocA family oxidoreductase [Armatimonadota bacterium]
MTRLRIGVIGTGFGSQVQIPAFRAHPRAAVVAVASATPGKAAAVARRFDIPYAFDRWEELIEADLDLVSVTPQPVWHYPMSLAAMDRGRHVLCEKPMAMNTAEAVEMLAHAERAGIIHAIDHELRFNPNRRKIKTLIDDGFLGRPRHALITVVSGGRADPARPWTWWADASQGGGLLGAQASHQIDLLRFYLGEITGVSGVTETFIRERPVPGGTRPVTSEDFTTFALHFASGAVATVLLSVVAAHAEGPRIELWGDEGSLRLDGQERLWGARKGGEWRELTEPETLTAPPGMDYPSLWGLSFVRFADHLIAAILDHSPLAPAATFADGLAVQRVLDVIRQSRWSAPAR